MVFICTRSPLCGHRATLPMLVAACLAVGWQGGSALALDLSISDVRLSATVAPGAPVPLDVVVRSNDACPDCGPVELSYWDDSNDGIFSCSDGNLITAAVDLTAESETTIHVVLNGYPRPGKYRAWFWVDCRQTLPEDDTTNNVQSLDIAVTMDGASGVGDGNGGAETPGEQVSPDPVEVADEGSVSDSPPSFCGMFGGPSALGAAAIPAFCVLGLIGLKCRRTWSSQQHP